MKAHEGPLDRENHRIAVTGIVWKKKDDGQRVYLITKRALTKKVWPGKWTVPGGGLEVDDYINTEPTYQNSESPQWYNAVENTLRREIREECGLEIEDIRYLLDVAFIRPDGIPVIVLSFYCTYAGGEIAYDEDTIDHAWVTVDQVGAYDLIQGIDHEIKLADKKLSE